MGKKDDYQFDYLDDNNIFADQINGALFKGKQIIKAEELEVGDSQIINTVSIEGIENTRRSSRKKNAGSIRTVWIRFVHGAEERFTFL